MNLRLKKQHLEYVIEMLICVCVYLQHIGIQNGAQNEIDFR